jgi:predicted ester cyclase
LKDPDENCSAGQLLGGRERHRIAEALQVADVPLLDPVPATALPAVAPAVVAANKAAVRGFVERGFNTGDLAVWDEAFAPTVSRDTSAGRAVRSREEIKAGATRTRRMVPDRRRTIEDLFAEGDRVVVRWTDRGTHQGEIQFGSYGRWGPFPPTGTQLTLTGILIYRLAGGRIVEEWFDEDLLGLLRQLGALPPGG